MAQRAGRITCPRCGANNFDTVTSCWKCGAPVGATPMAAPPAMAPAPQSQPQPQMAAPAPYMQERASVPSGYSQPAPVSYAPAPVSGDSGMARRAAIALALTIPFVGLPVGWVFMMIEDRNKQAIGRVCANWSMIGLVIHLILTYFMVQATVGSLGRLLLPVIAGAARKSAAGPDSMPDGGGLP